MGDMKVIRCKTCKYFELIGDSDINGECRRYPLMVEKKAHQWCGEHKSQGKAK